MAEEQNNILNQALLYRSKGLSVIPLHSKSKNPAIPWKDYQEVLPTEGIIKKWFSENPDYNIGIVTGKISGVMVLDFDTKNQEVLEQAKLLQTPIVETAKGFHVYFSYEKGAGNLQRIAGNPIDLKTDGGFVVAPPSTHESGTEYKWLSGKDISLPLLPLPALLRDLIQQGRIPEEKKPLKDLFKGSLEGERNVNLTRAIGGLVKIGLTKEDCLGIALSVNQMSPVPLGDSEVAGIVDSVIKTHQRNHPEGVISPDMDFRSILVKGFELQRLECKVEWAVEKLLPRQSITLLHGRGGIGKTWLSLLLANAVSLGIPFMGLNTTQMPVTYVDFENALPVLVERVKKLGIRDVNFWHSSNEILRPSRLDGADWENYKRLPLGLLIFDTLRAAQGRDENDSQQMAFIMARLKELRDKGQTILILHHTPKANDRTYKGSTAIIDLADHELGLHKVRKANLDEAVIDDDEDNPDCCYRFGTKSKTRYEPFHIYLEFDKEKTFIPAEDPDEELMMELKEMIVSLINSGELPNQGQILQKGKEVFGRTKTWKLLKKGEGKYWESTRLPEKNALVYNLIEGESKGKASAGYTLYDPRTNETKVSSN